MRIFFMGALLVALGVVHDIDAHRSRRRQRAAMEGSVAEGD
jgi:hypothetical protein